MAGDKNYLAQNIKNLRKAYDESQMDLAYAIGLNAPTAVSNYESGTRSPKPEFRRKIAAHFRITEEQLMHVDLSDMRKISFNMLNDPHKIQEVTFSAFPIVCSESALKNESFDNGYNAHIRIKQCMLAGKEANEEDCDICFEAYSKAFEEDEIPEAAGNMLWWLTVSEYNIINYKVSDGAQQLLKNKISGIEFIRRYYLKNFEFDDEADTVIDSDKKENVEFINDFEEMVQDLLKKLQSTKLVHLAYYYLAIRYAYGIVRNELSPEMNEAIGNEMLLSFSELGNVYAYNYMQALKQNF